MEALVRRLHTELREGLTKTRDSETPREQQAQEVFSKVKLKGQGQEFVWKGAR